MAAVQAAMDRSSGANNTLKLENVSHSAVQKMTYHDLTGLDLDRKAGCSHSYREEISGTMAEVWCLPIRCAIHRRNPPQSLE